MASQNTLSPPRRPIASGATTNGTSRATVVVRDPRPVAKHRDEGEQVERERHHPQERRRRDVGGDVGGDRDHEAGRDGGERRSRRRRSRTVTGRRRVSLAIDARPGRRATNRLATAIETAPAPRNPPTRAASGR